MESSWKLTYLNEVLNFSNGKSSPERNDNMPYPVYGSNGIIGFSDRVNSTPNTIIIGRVGSYCGSLYFSKTDCWITDNAIQAQALPKNNPHFLFYLLRSLNLNNWKSGSGQPLLNQSILGSIQAKVPDYKTQESIADVLSALDNKVNVNIALNSTIEKIAQTIFKSWFIDFDPVHAKKIALEKGLSKEQSERAAMAIISGVCSPSDFAKNFKEMDQCLTQKLFKMNKKHQKDLVYTASLFPSEFEDSELGEIPKGLQLKKINEALELWYGKALKKSDRIAGEYPVYGSGGIIGNHDSFLVKGPGIIVGRKGTVGSIYWEERDFFPIDTTYFVKPIEEYNLVYLFHLLKSQNLESMNTDAAVPGLNRNNVYRLKFIDFPKEIRDKYDSIVNSLFDLTCSNLTEIKILEKLRNTLLPKLLAGEIDLSSIKLDQNSGSKGVA